MSAIHPSRPLLDRPERRLQVVLAALTDRQTGIKLFAVHRARSGLAPSSSPATLRGLPEDEKPPVPPIPTRSSGAWQVRFCITAELGERLRPEPHLRLRYSCSPYHQNSALFRFIGELGRAARFGSGDEPAAS